jgi:hypothetical protein
MATNPAVDRARSDALRRVKETPLQKEQRLRREAQAAAAAKLRAVAEANRKKNLADPFGALLGPDRDAAVALAQVFKDYGLESLTPQIIKMIQGGFSAETISIQLRDTKEYKARFSANDKRVKLGLPALSPAEYISTERAYRQVMSQAGLPVGFYDQTSDFEKFLVQDVSPTEVKGRVDAVTEALNKAPAGTVDYFKKFYNTGDMIAYALDPAKAQPLIEQRLKAAEAASIASSQGFGLNQSQAERIGATGSSFADIQQGLGFIGQEQQTTDKLSAIYGDSVSTDDLVNEVFNGDAAAGAKRKKLASQERATFGGSSGQTKTSLNRASDGNI